MFIVLENDVWVFLDYTLGQLNYMLTLLSNHNAFMVRIGDHWLLINCSNLCRIVNILGNEVRLMFDDNWFLLSYIQNCQIFVFWCRFFDDRCLRDFGSSVNVNVLDRVASQVCNIMENCVIGRFDLMSHGSIFIDGRFTIEISLWMV